MNLPSKSRCNSRPTKLNLILLQSVDETRPNISGGHRTAFDVGDDGRFGLIVTGSCNELRTKVVTSQNPFSSDLQLDRDSETL